MTLRKLKMLNEIENAEREGERREQSNEVMDKGLSEIQYKASAQSIGPKHRPIHCVLKGKRN